MPSPEAHPGRSTSHGITPRELGIGRLFERTSDAVIVSDLEGHIVLWNPGAERMFGWSREEALGQQVEIIMPERMVARHRAGMARFRETGRGALIESHLPVELPAVDSEGRELMIELSLSAIRAEGGDHVLAIVRDVTERTRLRKEVEQERNALRAANESLEAFTYVVSHDLKEPVRGIGAFLDALRENPDARDRDELIARAIDANRRMEHLLAGLLEWSRVAAAPVESEPVDVGEVLRDPNCTIQFQNLVDERGARLDVADGLPVVMASQALVCQVFGNLITNAIRHNPRGTPHVRVTPGRDEGGLVEVVVRDDGPGFPQMVLDRMRALKNRPSTVRGGFGLAITRRAVERLGGRLVVDNAPEGGGFVSVWLPRAPE